MTLCRRRKIQGGKGRGKRIDMRRLESHGKVKQRGVRRKVGRAEKEMRGLTLRDDPKRKEEKKNAAPWEGIKKKMQQKGQQGTGRERSWGRSKPRKKLCGEGQCGGSFGPG